MKRQVLTITFLLFGSTLTFCQPPETSADASIKTRFTPPAGYERMVPPKQSFADFLQNLPLYPEGRQVYLHNGLPKGNQNAQAAVIQLDVGKRNLQQCADAIIRLRAEYLWAAQKYDQIVFHFTNGFKAPYSRWRAGERIRVKGNEVTWVARSSYSDSYATFRKYLDMIFAYAGTISLHKALKPTDLENLEIGDVFIEAGSPGHAVIVVDMAVSALTGKKCFLLAQSYMPAQDIHVLKNPGFRTPTAWYFETDLKNTLITPEWSFPAQSLKRF